MYGQMTAGSWIYIGTQGILQGTYETFAQAGRTHFGTADLSGRLVLTGGLGGMGGAQPLAATMNERRVPGRGDRSGPRPAPRGDALPGRGGARTSTRPWRWPEEAQKKREGRSIAVDRQRGRRCSASCTGAA